MPVDVDAKLGRRLVLDELFDLSLYRALHCIAPDHLRRVLDQLIPVEKRHLAFWRGVFGLPLERLDLSRRLKLAVVLGLCRIFGAPAIHLALEAIEVIPGAQSVLASLLVAGTMIVVVSALLAFLSGMDVRRRIAMNLVIVAAAVGITYVIGTLTRSLWGITV